MPKLFARECGCWVLIYRKECRFSKYLKRIPDENQKNLYFLIFCSDCIYCFIRCERSHQYLGRPCRYLLLCSPWNIWHWFSKNLFFDTKEKVDKNVFIQYYLIFFPDRIDKIIPAIKKVFFYSEITCLRQVMNHFHIIFLRYFHEYRFPHLKLIGFI